MLVSSQQVPQVSIAAQRDYMRVLDEQKLIADLSALPLFDELALDLEPFGITDSPKMAHFTMRR
jgi:hypothetical protein